MIIKPTALGDVITALPVLRGINRTFPRARVSWLLAEPGAALLEDDEELDEIILFRRKLLGQAWWRPKAMRELVKLLKHLSHAGFDWVIDLQGLLRSGLLSSFTGAAVRAGFDDAREGAPLFYNHPVRPAGSHTVDRNIAVAGALGVDSRPSDMRLYVSPRRRMEARKLLSDSGLTGKSYLVCAPTTRWDTKQYPLRHWRKVVSSLSERMSVVLVAPVEDRDFCRQIADGAGDNVLELSGKTSIGQFVGIIASSSGVVCCDSAAKFIAPATGKCAVTLMGPTRLDRTGPYLLGTAVSAPVPCRGCLKRRCRHITCMESIRPDDVVSAVEKMLK